MSEQTPVRVLILDDDAALVRMAELSLVIEGFEVTTAGDGIAGLQCVEEQPFDAIVLDLQMPKMDGATFLRTVRGRGNRTPVVVVSAYDSALSRLDTPAEAKIRKPFEPETLVAAVRQLIARASSVGA
jgi:two-component system response regulator MprA